MGRKANSPVTVCGNSRNVTFDSLERQNRKWPLSATDLGAGNLALVNHELLERKIFFAAIAN